VGPLPRPAVLREAGCGIGGPWRAVHPRAVRRRDAEDPFNLNPDLLYPIIDATTVKRTRQFIKKHYENDLIRLRDGSRVPIRFPKPVASSINYDLEEVLPAS
jgi:hypothetical protein